MRSVLLFLLFVGLAPAAPALASQVDRAGVTLGRLVDDLDLALIVRVTAVEDEVLALEPLEALRGAAPVEPLRLALPHEVAHDLRVRPGERLLVFLALGPDGRAVAPATVWQTLRVDDEPALEAVRDAVRSRAPTIGGDVRALERALFAQLASSVERVRDDAALDLLAFRELSPGAAEVGGLGRALERAATIELAQLAGRLRDLALVPALLTATREGPTPEARQAAAEALAATDPAAGADVLAADLDAADPARAVIAVSGLSALRHPRASARVTRALGDPRPPVRAAALRALAARPVLEAIEPLVELARAGPDAEARAALAALARAGQGRALARIEAEHPDPTRRALAGALRADPVVLADEVLAGLDDGASGQGARAVTSPSR